MIRASNLSVRLSGKLVLHGVGIDAQAGQLTAIVGPNGSGKTTSLKAIAGELPYEGSVSINGHDISRLKPWQLALKRAVLPQSTVISFPFTIREIVGMGLSVGTRTVDGKNDEIVKSALEAVDLSGFAGRLYQELSGGEQQRVLLARALCQIWDPLRNGEPAFLLLDEPVSSLDIRHQLTIMRLARDFCRRGGGVVAIMHDLNLTAMFADRMIMMKAGRVQAAGSPNEVMTDAMVEKVFGCAMRVNTTPREPVPFVLPHTALG
jgi:iron complex transport system ATP-binding protein